MEGWMIGLAGLCLTVLSIIVSRAVSLGYFKSRNDQLVEKVKRVEKGLEQIETDYSNADKELLTTIRRYLFSEQNGGGQLYVTANRCKEERMSCNNTLCKKIDDFQSANLAHFQQIEVQRSKEKEALDKTLLDLHEFVGEVKGLMKHLSKET